MERLYKILVNSLSLSQYLRYINCKEGGERRAMYAHFLYIKLCDWRKTRELNGNGSRNTCGKPASVEAERLPCERLSLEPHITV